MDQFANFYLPSFDFGGFDLSGITPSLIEQAVAAASEPVAAPAPVYAPVEQSLLDTSGYPTIAPVTQFAEPASALFNPIRMETAGKTVTPLVTQAQEVPTADFYLAQGWSPEQAAEFAAYEADPSAMQSVYIPDAGWVQLPGSAAAVNAMNARFIPGDPQYEASADFVFNRDVEHFNYIPERIVYNEGDRYRLIDQRTGDVLGTAASAPELRDLSSKAVQFSNDVGKQAAYALQRYGAGDNGWGTVGSYYYSPLTPTQVAGQFVSTLGAVVAAPFAPFYAAIPQVVGGAMQGLSIEDIATNAALATGLSYAGQNIPGAVGGEGAVGGAGGAGGALGAVDDIVVTAASPALSGIGSVVGNALTNATGPTQTVEPPPTAPTDIIVTAPTTAPPVVPVAPPPPLIPDVGAVYPETVVEAQPAEPSIDDTPIAVPVEGPIAQPLTPEQIAEQVPEADPEQKSLIDQLIDAYRLYALGSGLLGGGGGSGGLTGTQYTPTLGRVPTFSQGTFQPYTGDYERYGFGPEWNFFSQPSPAPVLPAAQPTAPTNPFANIPTLNYTPLI